MGVGTQVHRTAYVDLLRVQGMRLYGQRRLEREAEATQRLWLRLKILDFIL